MESLDIPSGFETGAFRIYQNGNLLLENSGTNVIFGGNVDAFSVGTGHNQDFWKGSLDELEFQQFFQQTMFEFFKIRGLKSNYLNLEMSMDRPLFSEVREVVVSKYKFFNVHTNISSSQRLHCHRLTCWSSNQCFNWGN